MSLYFLESLLSFSKQSSGEPSWSDFAPSSAAHGVPYWQLHRFSTGVEKRGSYSTVQAVTF